MIRLAAILSFLMLLLINNCLAYDTSLNNIASKELKPSILVGKSHLTVMLTKIYDIYLWTEKKEWSPDHKALLCRVYNKSVHKDRLLSFSLKEMKRIHGLSPATIQDYKTKLTPLIPNVKQGDSVCLAINPGQGIKFIHNGGPPIQIPESNLSQHFQDIWLHPKTRYPTIRQDLLNLRKKPLALSLLNCHY